MAQAVSHVSQSAQFSFHLVDSGPPAAGELQAVVAFIHNCCTFPHNQHVEAALIMKAGVESLQVLVC